nr:putative ribonuclease h protein [Quercus suber]
MLIIPSSGWWNIRLIDRYFHPPNAKLIKSLPLCSIPQSDMLIWPKEKTGIYFVKSGYKLLCEWQKVELNKPQIPDTEKNFWSSIWKIKVPRKIKHFLWKACANLLPTKENLMKRRILQDSVCQRCLNGLEDVVHSLWSCDDLREIRSFARDYIRDFQNLTCIPSCSVCTTPRRWCPPVDDVWKVNFNGAMFGEFDEAGIVVVIRDSRGEVKAALSEKIKKPPTVDVLELLAAKRAMTFSLETGTTRALVEGDSATVIKAIQLGGWELAQGGHLIHDISILKNSFQSISFSHVVWQGNAVAHALAHRARHSFPLSVLVEHVPQDIVSFFLHDLRFS